MVVMQAAMVKQQQVEMASLQAQCQQLKQKLVASGQLVEKLSRQLYAKPQQVGSRLVILLFPVLCQSVLAPVGHHSFHQSA